MALRSIVFVFGASGNLSQSTYRANPSVPGQSLVTAQSVVCTFDDSISKNRLYKALEAIEQQASREQLQTNSQLNAGVPI